MCFASDYIMDYRIFISGIQILLFLMSYYKASMEISTDSTDDKIMTSSP